MNFTFRTNRIIIINIGFMMLLSIGEVIAQNPVIRNQFSGDPSARVIGDRVYLYPSHDIVVRDGRGRKGWFCMEDYHVFSSENLSDWKDHGVIVQQNKVAWVKPDSYAMWAPDCIFRNGKYYFYFPATAKDTIRFKGFAIGVGISDKPEGPFVTQALPIENVHGIDPNVLIDNDGQAYLYWSAGNIYGARLKENMVELASSPVTLQNLPEKGLKEGPYVFFRKGLYYLTYPHVENKIERLEYATSTSPLGPFKFSGVIMDESSSGCWTNHQSITEYKKQWYLFYHDNDYSPAFDKNRSVRVDSLFFKADGSITKVIPTLRGVGTSNALANIQLDRYSKVSGKGIAIAFLDTAKRFDGWKTELHSGEAWLQYNAVDFGSKSLKNAIVNASSASGGTLEVRIDSMNGRVLAEINVPRGAEWSNHVSKLLTPVTGVHKLVVRLKVGATMEVDWIRFER